MKLGYCTNEVPAFVMVLQRELETQKKIVEQASLVLIRSIVDLSVTYPDFIYL